MNTSKEPPAEAAKALLEIADAADAWWRSHRPLKWRKKKHLTNPEVNISADAGKRLARAVAAWKSIGG
jgi:hypothetical protein